MYNNMYGNYQPRTNFVPMEQQMPPQPNMAQQMPQFQQQQQPFPQQQPQQNTTQVNYVASLEEVRAYPVDWSGNVSYFVDRANNCIYTKQIGLDGIPKVDTYRLDTNDKKVEYVTREEFETVKGALDSLLSQLGGGTNE